MIYNGLVRLNVQANNAWSDIDVQLKRRHDLIPNVVEAVKGAAGFERQTLERVTEARARAVSAQGAGPAQPVGGPAGLLRGCRGISAAPRHGELCRTAANAGPDRRRHPERQALLQRR